MKNLKKKGFTIVELVIVIAVIAILSAVLIPTFSSLIRKANISSDTVLSKNLNTALKIAEVENGVNSFDEALEAIKENGYLIANLNAKADGCFFVWESKTNQILLVDSKNNYEVLFSLEEYEPMGETWHFAISNKTIAKKVNDDLKDKAVIIKQTIANVKDLKEALSTDSQIYIDESLVLDISNRLEFNTDGVTVEVNLENSQLTSNGTLDDEFPIEVKKGNVIINGGIIGAAGSKIDLDGNLYSTPIDSITGSTVTLNNTKFNGDNSTPIQFSGKAELNNVTLNGAYFYSYGNGNVTLNDCEANIKNEVVLWVTNTIKHDDGTTTYDGSSTLTVNGGKYEGDITGEGWGIISVHDGTIVIKNGEFISEENHMFGLIGTTCPKIEISGGTFNGKSFDKLVQDGIDAWKNLCAGEYTIVISDDLKTVTISK